MIDCYLGIGGNFESTPSLIRQVIESLEKMREISQLQASKLYRTTPVSEIFQPDYWNAVCRFHCTMKLHALWEVLQQMEKKLGKIPKMKNAPRAIDLDLLFYGSLVFSDEHLTIPHPRWQERLFVLAPLTDLTERIDLDPPIDLITLMDQFSNPHKEKVVALCSL